MHVDTSSSKERTILSFISEEQVVALAREDGERGHEAWALLLLGEIASRNDPPGAQRAEGHYRQALALDQAFVNCEPIRARAHALRAKPRRGDARRRVAIGCLERLQGVPSKCYGHLV